VQAWKILPITQALVRRLAALGVGDVFDMSQLLHPNQLLLFLPFQVGYALLKINLLICKH